MAEAVANPSSKAGSTVLIVVLVVILIGGGIGAYFLFKPKTKDDPLMNSKNPSDGGADSRNNVSGQYNTKLTDAQIAALLGQNLSTNTPSAGQAGSKEKPWFVNDPDFQKLLEKKAEAMQGSSQTMDIIRLKYDIGKAMVVSQNQDSLKALKDMFSKRVDAYGNFPDFSKPNYWVSFPIYGTKEPNGLKYRTELQGFINLGWEGYNLTETKRHSGTPWWLPNLKFNLLVGTINAETPSASDVWFNVWKPEQRDFFKGMNGHWKDDKELVDVFVKKDAPSIRTDKWDVNGRAAFCAGYMFSAVESWIAEIDRLDKAVKTEALRFMMLPVDKGGEGIYVSFLDPKNPSANLYADYGLPTNYKPQDDTKPIIKP